MSLKLIYFKMRALAEAPQLLMRCNKIDYDYLMSWEHFGDVWDKIKPTITFKQLPILDVEGGHQIAQSTAILQYLENRAGLTIQDPIKSAKACAILLSSQDLFAPLNPTVNFAVGEDFIKKRDNMRPVLASRFADLSRCLDDYDGKFFIDDIPRAAEFAAYHHLDLSKLLDPTIIAEFPRLEEFISDMENISGVSEYLSERPELVEVGKEPKLVIDGTFHPTGLHQT
ncbi:MAG: glutathione S-transferase family protein [Alphaproteobacteria bacterium]|nr:glutathione S-transferase family protein [Alphaproteobacteria bacterium]